MRKSKRKRKIDELRPAYKRADFPEPLVRGKYAERVKASSNVVVLEPEVAEAFPNGEAVNSALKMLLDVAHKATEKPSKAK